MAEFKAQKKAAAKAEKAAQMEVRKAEKDAKMANMTEGEMIEGEVTVLASRLRCCWVSVTLCVRLHA
jgi:ribosomal protein S1